MILPLCERIAATLTQARIPFVIVAAPTLPPFGARGLSGGIRITLGAELERRLEVLDAIQALRLITLSEPYHFARRSWVLPCFDSTTGLRVDFLLARAAYQRQVLARARPVTLGGSSVPFASLEDLVITLLVTGRPDDLEYARRVLTAVSGQDIAYIRGWLERFASEQQEAIPETVERLLKEFAA